MSNAISLSSAKKTYTFWPSVTGEGEVAARQVDQLIPDEQAEEEVRDE
jgi:hypothetical protein